ncbi:MAG: hypothetical protein ACOH5I_26640, partial [Oligoflexus sp.]
EVERKAEGKVELKPEREVERKAEGKVELKPEREVERKAEGKVELKPELEVERKAEGKVELKPELEVERKAEGKVELKPELEVERKAEGKVELKAEREVERKAEGKVELTKLSKYLLNKKNNMFLSDSIEYTIISKSQLNVLSEICKLCIVSGNLYTERVSYEYLSKKSSVKLASIKSVVRKLESSSILILRDHQYTLGAKGRSFEISKQALFCMLEHNLNLKRWVARQGLKVTDVKKHYDFK